MPADVSGLSYANGANLARTGVPWWGTGTSEKETQYDHWLTDDEAKAEIGFPVATQPLYRRTQNGLYVPIDDSQETVRLDTDAHIATVGNWYTPFGGEALIDLGSVLVDDYGAKWDTVGRLRNDRIVFGALRLDVVSQEGRGLASIDDSDYYSWLLLSDTLDGSQQLNGCVVCIRAVCTNTYTAARRGAKGSWSIRHVGDIAEKAKVAHESLGLATAHQAEFSEWAEKLAATRFEIEEFDDFAKELFPVGDKGDRAKRTAEANTSAVKANWLHSQTIADDIRFTRWGALNGVTEWAEHIKDPRDDKRVAPRERKLLSTLFGGPVEQTRSRASALLSKGVK